MIDERVHLVDADGFDTASWEKGAVPFDPQSPENWPSWCDADRWELGPEPGGKCDIVTLSDEPPDAPDDPRIMPYGAQCHALATAGVVQVKCDNVTLDLPPIAGGSPEPFEPSPQDWEDYARAFADIDASDPPANQISPDELSMLAAGLPVG